MPSCSASYHALIADLLPQRGGRESTSARQAGQYDPS